MKTVLLGDVCDIQIGGTPSRSDFSLWDRGRSTNNVWVSIADLNNTDGNIINDSKEYVSDKAAPRLRLVKKGTLLVSFKLTIGRLAFAGRDLFTNEAIAALKIKNEKELDKNYLYHYLKFFDWDDLSKGEVKVKGRTLNKAKLKIIKFAYPESIEEQRLIVKKLEEAFEKIDKVIELIQKNLQNSQELFESEKSRIFDINEWPQKKISDLGITQTGTTPKTENKNNYGDFIPFIKPSDFKKDGTLRYDNHGLSKTGLKAGRLIKANSVLMVCIGATIGKSGYCERDVSCNQQINTVELQSLQSARFIYYQISTSRFFNQIVRYAPQTTMPILNKSNWNNLTVAVPDQATQVSVAKKLDALSLQSQKLQKLYQQKFDNLQELKKSLLDKAFKGEL